MKKIFLIIAIVFVTGSYAQVTKATLEASGLTCAMCSKAVYKALSGVLFVEKVEPNIQQSNYTLTFKPGSNIDFDVLSKAVTDAGFSVSMLKVATVFHDVKVQDDTHTTINGQMFHFVNVQTQTLNGERTVKFIDKNFVSAKEYKKNSKATLMKCYESGVMDGKRVYHVTI